MKSTIQALLFLLSISCTKGVFNSEPDANPDIDTSRAALLSALEYLNSVRAAPPSYSDDLNVDLDNVSPRPPLVWNDTLATVAKNKAADMASRNYFAHTDPDGNGMNIKIHEGGYTLSEAFLKTKADNYFESLSAGEGNTVNVIKTLIVDKGTNPPAHRDHLLGISQFWSNCYDIGIGFVPGTSGSKYRSYCCILIAKHDF